MLKNYDKLTWKSCKISEPAEYSQHRAYRRWGVQECDHPEHPVCDQAAEEQGKGGGVPES